MNIYIKLSPPSVGGGILCRPQYRPYSLFISMAPSCRVTVA